MAAALTWNPSMIFHFLQSPNMQLSKRIRRRKIMKRIPLRGASLNRISKKLYTKTLLTIRDTSDSRVDMNLSGRSKTISDAREYSIRNLSLLSTAMTIWSLWMAFTSLIKRYMKTFQDNMLMNSSEIKVIFRRSPTKNRCQKSSRCLVIPWTT